MVPVGKMFKLLFGSCWELEGGYRVLLEGLGLGMCEL